MVALEGTGAFLFALIMAVSQFIEPLPPEKVAEVTALREMSTRERAIFEFQPVPLATLEAFTNEELAVYIRTACSRMRNEAVLTEESFDKGRLVELSVINMVANGVDVASLQQLQSRLLPDEEFDPAVAVRYFVKACEDQDERFPLEVLTYYDLKGAVQTYREFADNLPKLESLADLPTLPQLVEVVDSAGNRLAELSQVDTSVVEGAVQVVRRNRRIILPEDQIPELMMRAIVAVEDSRFWNFQPEDSASYRGHKGFDFKGALRAGNSTASGGGVQGASTITMQLVKNYILYQDVYLEHLLAKRSMYRKLREVIVADQIEQLLTKKQILALYLNTIDFGRGSQGVALAAEVYFSKPLAELELQEFALLAALPKGPSYYNPDTQPERILERRNYVLSRMSSEGFITNQEYQDARKKPLGVQSGQRTRSALSPYSHFYMSEVQNAVFTGARTHNPLDTAPSKPISVYMEPDLQRFAVQALQQGLLDFERNNGELVMREDYDQLPNIKEDVERRAKEKKQTPLEAFAEVLKDVPHPYEDGPHFEKAVVLSRSTVGLESGEIVKVSGEDQKLFFKKQKTIDGKKQKASLAEWDVVLVERRGESYRLVSFTEVQGAILVIENNTGHVLATSGGFSIGKNNRYFGPTANRAFHALRQPGSTLKPFLYLKALNEGATPDMQLSNTPISFPERYIDKQRHCDRWRPGAYSNDEPPIVTVSKALASSRNLAAAHLFNFISGDNRSTYMTKDLYLENPDREATHTRLSDQLDRLWSLMMSFGIYDSWPDIGPCYSVILGSRETTVARLATAYAMIANGGRPIRPTLFAGQYDEIPMNRPEVQINPEAYFQTQDILREVLRSGTSTQIREWAEVIFGKTGTSNSNKDAWFVGSTKDITVAVWMGYTDGTRTLGAGGTGGRASVPIFRRFMEKYFEKYGVQGRPEAVATAVETDRQSLSEVWVDPATGLVFDAATLQLFFEHTAQNRVSPPLKKINEVSVSPVYLAGDPANSVFWRLVFEYMSLEKLERVRQSYQSFYQRELQELTRLEERCQVMGAESEDCRERDAIRARMQSLFEFYYLNRLYF
jgi:penicillin-binding protein 1A